MRLLLVLLIMLPSLVSAQKEIELKRRYFGNYEGKVASYKMGSAINVVDVDESTIQIILAKDQIAVTVGNRKIYGTYEVMFEADKYYLLDAKMNGQIVNERILVYKRGRRISRDGLYPQPVSNMKKVRRFTEGEV